MTSLSCGAFLSPPSCLPNFSSGRKWCILYSTCLKGTYTHYCAGVRDGKAKVACEFNSEETFLVKVTDVRECWFLFRPVSAFWGFWTSYVSGFWSFDGKLRRLKTSWMAAETTVISQQLKVAKLINRVRQECSVSGTWGTRGWLSQGWLSSLRLNGTTLCYQLLQNLSCAWEHIPLLVLIKVWSNLSISLAKAIWSVIVNDFTAAIFQVLALY